MKSSIRLTLSFRNTNVATSVVAAASGRETEAVRVQRQGAKILAEAVADDPMTLLRIVDSYLARVGLAERSGAQSNADRRKRTA